jgi:transposase-like protein
MARTRRRFTAEYRVEAAHRVIDSDRTIAEVARELGVGEQLLGRWVRDERVRLGAAAPAGPDAVEEPLNDSERAELARLRRRVVEQEKRISDQSQDVAFLKKASAYFAAMQPK